MLNGASAAGAGGFEVLDRRYLLVIPIPCFVDIAGAVWLERGWHRDLLQHLSYIERLVLCAPAQPRAAEPDLVRFEPPPQSQISFTFLPPQTSFVAALGALPRTAAILWKAVGRADIVHSGIIGWPYPLGWLANPFALLRRKKLVIVVESDWRITGVCPRSWWRKLGDMNPLRHWMARWSCEHAHLALFTQASYQAELGSRHPERTHVTPAVWVNDADLLDDEAARASWDVKLKSPVRLLFAGRMVSDKGVDVLLRSLRALDARGVQAHVDVIGRGDRLDACVRAAAELRAVRLMVLEPVPYGARFFELVRGHHAVLVPSLSNEQPRIVFDANAQAVPVIASDTDGLRPHVAHGRTGWLVPTGDAAALADAIARAGCAASELRDMGLSALTASRGFSHHAMHVARSRLLRTLLS